MKRLTDIFEAHRDEIRHGNFIDAYADVKRLAKGIREGDARIEGSPENVFTFYETSFALREGMRYVVTSTALVTMLIGLEAQLRSHESHQRGVGGFVGLSFTHYLASAGMKAIGENRVVVDDSTDGIYQRLEHDKRMIEFALNQYWRQTAVLSEGVEVIYGAVEYSRNWRHPYQSDSDEMSDELFEKMREEGFTEKMDTVCQHGRSDWNDTHAKIFMDHTDSGSIDLCKGDYNADFLGFFNLLFNKTGFDHFNRRRGIIYKKK